MIILKHLIIEHFRLLREINLYFPQCGSILIQGPNEAGKSALLESIYFALYGESLASKRSSHSLDDLVLYGAPQATVTLVLSIGTTEMTITRSITRSEAGGDQKVTLQVRKLGMPAEEPITHLATANEHIIAELGCIDGEALRGSCFIEQKGLSRLENLPGGKREAVLRKLLGLEKLLYLADRFKLTSRDEHILTETSERLKLAELQAHIPELSQQLGRLETALDAVSVSEDLAEISQQEADIAEQDHALEHLRRQRAELKGCLGRIQQLRKADTTLEEISMAYDAMAEARRELPDLERQIAELDRREREELPALEQRVNELVDLIRSFGTLERMSNDLLTSVNSIKQLEQELKEQQELHGDNNNLDEQIITVRLQLDQARQSFNELEEQRRAGRPQLKARLQRLQELRERLTALHQAEEKYTQRVMNQEQEKENSTQLKRVQQDIQATEQKQAQVEWEAQQAQQQIDTLEKRLLQFRVSRQLEEWQRLKGLSQALREAEQNVKLAHEHQEQITHAALDARQVAQRQLLFIFACNLLGLAMGIGAIFVVFHYPILAAVMGLIALVAFAGGAYTYHTYNKVHSEEQIAHQQMQEAISQVGMMVAAREAALHAVGGQREAANGDYDALAQVEQEIRVLGGTVPRSREEAENLLEAGRSEDSVDIGDIQGQLIEQGDAATAARNQLNATREALAVLRTERDRLEELRKGENWDDIEVTLRSKRIAIEDKRHEIATLAGQEGLPIPSFFSPFAREQDLTSGPLPPMTDSNFAIALGDAIKATEREIASLDGKIDSVSELAAQVKVFQDALDQHLLRKREVTERIQYLKAQDPAQQIERTRQQQVALRTALQTLQDSLRQRVKPLGVPFGQAAISSAEMAARKQLEALHFILASRVEFQSRHDTYVSVLKQRQDLLSSSYNQLTKFSGSLGIWVVPPNPFAETLAALRIRCRQEISAANESNILQELEKLQHQENASRAKIELCRQEIAEAQERIAAMLVQRSRPAAKAYSFKDIVLVWPLVGKYTPQDRNRLTEECETLEQTLQQQEQQELVLSERLQTRGHKLDVEQARLDMEQQNRNYQAKKYGSLLLQAVVERLLRQMLPRTEYYMQQILPLLTSGRYHDIQLRTDEAEGTASGGLLQLRVWDTAACTYVPKSALSGGAADQLSLALRLAFAIAALPRELSAAPGFICLDEPLSSFDRGRAQALVDVLTGDILGQHFEQILLISSSSAFEPTAFSYYIYMDGGAIVGSNLPLVPLPPESVTVTSNGGKEDNEDGKDRENEDNGNVSVAATPVPASVVVESQAGC